MEHRLRRVRLAHRVVRQDEFVELPVVIRRIRLHACILQARRFRRGVRIERWLQQRSAARPEAMADDFVRVRVALESRAVAWRRAATGKACHCQVETAPEEIHRAALADERATRLVKYTIDLHQDAPQATHVFGIVAVMLRVAVEPDRLRQFRGQGMDLHRQTHCRQHRQQFVVEIGDAACTQRQGTRLTI